MKTVGLSGYTELENVYSDMTHVTVQLFAYDESPATLEQTFHSVNRQVVPEDMAVTTEAWITPAEGRDRSDVLASRHGFDPHFAPGGKLTARNAAHNYVKNTRGGIIVSMDADAPMLSPTTLSALIEPVIEGDAIASNSRPIAGISPDGERSVIGSMIDVGGRIEDQVKPHVHGQCAAFTSAAWEKAGPFDTELDETEINEVRAEEEFRFYQKLIQIGEVVTVDEATVYNDPRRHICQLAPEMAPDGYCDRRGVETFQTDN